MTFLCFEVKIILVILSTSLYYDNYYLVCNKHHPVETIQVEYVLGDCALFAGGFGGGNAPSGGPLDGAGKARGENDILFWES